MWDTIGSLYEMVRNCNYPFRMSASFFDSLTFSNSISVNKSHNIPGSLLFAAKKRASTSFFRNNASIHSNLLYLATICQTSVHIKYAEEGIWYFY
jgi:hypothetical protein